MNSKTDDLLKILSELVELYEKHESDHWRNWIQKSRKEIEAKNLNGITRFLSAFGGMGSIGDTLFAKKVWWSNTLLVQQHDNEKLQSLLNDAYKLATEIKRDYEHDT